MQINRLFEIIYVLLQKRIVTAEELSQRFEVSTRTIYRDVETLSSCGIPVYMRKGKGGGISLLDNFVLNKALLTTEEKSNILSSLKAINLLHVSESNTTIEKLSSLFGDSNGDWIEVDFTSWGNPENEKAIFNKLKSSILKRHIITFSYSSGKGETTERKVEPLKLCFKGQSWYLYGYCTTRCDYRFFKLNRIKNLISSDEYHLRKSPKQIFSEDNMLNDEFVKIKLKISPKMTFRVYDEFKDFEKLEDGSFLAQLEIPRGQWLFNYVASFGEYCEVLEPEDIRLYIKTKFQNSLKNYL